MEGVSRSVVWLTTRPLRVLVVLCVLGVGFGFVHGQEVPDHLSGPHLQNDMGINFLNGWAVSVERTEGTSNFTLFQENGAGLSAPELGSTCDPDHCFEFSSTDAGAAEYRIGMTAPTIMAGTLRVEWVAKLGAGAVAANWKIDMYEYVGKDVWTNLGDLTDTTLGGWQTMSMEPGVPAKHFADSSSPGLLLRIYTTGASSKQTIYLDQITIYGVWNTPSPVQIPTLMPPPVAAPTAAPVSAPVANVGTGVVGYAVYVERIGSKGVDIISAQNDGLPLVNAENAAVSATTNSIEFTSTTLGVAEFEVYFSLSGVPSGGLTVGVVAQLGAGATAANWKVDLYEFVGKDDWTNIGDLAGVTAGTWSTVSPAIASGASNFVDSTSNEMLVRLYTSGASTQETIYVDQIHIIGGDDQPSPVPSPVAPPVAASTAAPVAAPAAAPEVTDGTGVVGSAVYVERVGNKGVVIISAQADGTPLVGAEYSAVSATADSIKFASTSQGVAEFEVYFTLPGVLTGGLTFSVVAQLGAGATATNWKVDLYEFVGKDDWTNIGDLTGVTTSAWSTASPAIASGASYFVDSTSNEMLARLYTSGASTQETIYVDQIQIIGE